MSNNLSPICATTKMKVFTKRAMQENESGSKRLQIGVKQENESSSLKEKFGRLEEDCKILRERQEEDQQVIKGLVVAIEKKEREFKEKVAELQVAKRKAEDMGGVWKTKFTYLHRQLSRLAKEIVKMEEEEVLERNQNPNLPKNVTNIDVDSIQEEEDSVPSSGQKKTRNVTVMVDSDDDEERRGDGNHKSLHSRLREKKRLFFGKDDSSFDHSSREVSEEQVSSSLMINKKVKSHRRCYEKEKHPTRRRKASSGQILCAEWREEVLRANWKSCHPICIKSISQSYISASSYFQLPKDFCKENLPPRDTAMMLLEDEKGLEFKFHYNAVRTRIRGWRRFSLNHNLKLGDVLIFELREPTKFKVCIVRADRDDLSAHFVGEDTDLMTPPKGKH